MPDPEIYDSCVAFRILPARNAMEPDVAKLDCSPIVGNLASVVQLDTAISAAYRPADCNSSFAAS